MLCAQYIFSNYTNVTFNKTLHKCSSYLSVIKDV
jgi:hypothetical protein